MKTEKEIIEDVKRGMASAFDKMYEAYSHKLYLFANSILKSREDAEEVVQNTFFKIWKSDKVLTAILPSNHFYLRLPIIL